MKLLRLPVPDTLFGRLFGAILGVVALTLLIIVLLIVRERRELSLLNNSAHAVANSIVDASEYLATLPPDERDAAQERLQTSFVNTDDSQLRRRAVLRENAAELEKEFRARVQKQLGNSYRVAVMPPNDARTDVVRLLPQRESSPPENHLFTGADSGQLFSQGTSRGGRVMDVVVVLPDGDQIVYRAPAPRAGPRPQPQIFIELAILTIVLSVVLYAMTRTITQPLAELKRAADAVGHGVAVSPLKESGASELKTAIRAFNDMQERLRRYLDSRTRVLAAMSHDLRTPLTRLRLRVESIEDEQVRERCAADLKEMTQMVTGALSVFRGLNNEEPLVACDVNALASELVAQYRELGRQVEMSGHATAPLQARTLSLKRCLSNLLDNALRFGTHATLVIEDGNALLIKIRDDGPGIPVEFLEQVFEPFFRLESSRNRDSGGAGLGLSIARDVAQAHDGSLTLGNRAGGGLEATLTIPRAARARSAS